MFQVYMENEKPTTGLRIVITVDGEKTLEQSLDEGLERLKKIYSPKGLPSLFKSTKGEDANT